MRIGELARRAGVTRDAVRFYEQRGLIASRRTSNGYREFPDEMLQQLGYVRTAQALGFSLAEVEMGMTGLLQDTGDPREARHVLNEKIAMIDRRIAELNALRDELHARSKLDCPFVQESVTKPRVPAAGNRYPAPFAAT